MRATQYRNLTDAELLQRVEGLRSNDLIEELAGRLEKPIEGYVVSDDEPEDIVCPNCKADLIVSFGASGFQLHGY